MANPSSSMMAKHRSLPNILSKATKYVPKKETSFTDCGTVATTNCDRVPGIEHAVKSNIPDWSVDQNNEVLSPDVFVPADLSILNYRFGYMNNI